MTIAHEFARAVFPVPHLLERNDKLGNRLKGTSHICISKTDRMNKINGAIPLCGGRYESWKFIQSALAVLFNRVTGQTYTYIHALLRYVRVAYNRVETRDTPA